MSALTTQSQFLCGNQKIARAQQRVQKEPVKFAVFANAGNTSGPKKGSKAKGGQAGVGYKGSTEAGSAPKTRSGKAGYVYKLGVRNGKANVDEYSPIYDPGEFKTDGDKYEGNLVYWAATLAGIIGSGALAIYLTSAL